MTGFAMLHFLGIVCIPEPTVRNVRICAAKFLISAFRWFGTESVSTVWRGYRENSEMSERSTCTKVIIILLLC